MTCGVIHVDVYSVDVTVFTSEQDRVSRLAELGIDVEYYHEAEAAFAHAHLDRSAAGEPRFTMVIKPDATIPTWAHECSHMADFILDTLGIPLTIENTEVRAYLVGYLMDSLLTMHEVDSG